MCKEEPEYWKAKSKQQVIAEYVLSYPENFSEFGKILKKTGLQSLLSVRGPFTLFLPTDEAFAEFLREKNLGSIDQIDDSLYLKRLVYTHLIATEIQTNDIGLGALRDTNALGDFLVTEFSGSDIVINKQARIIKRNIRTANGWVHMINKVIEPVTISIYDAVASMPDFKLFTQGLELTGLADTLKIINFPYGKKKARTRFTLLAVPDTIFNRYGINTIDDLAKNFTDQPNNVKELNNGFYRFMEYHCLGGTFYLSDFTSKLYPILSSDNNISVKIDTDYKLNVDKKTGLYTGFIIESSNFPTKNGALHVINDLLPVTEPAPTAMTFEVTDYFDMRQGDYFGKYYMKWSDGQNTFAKIKWGGDYLQYYYKNHDTGTLLNWDCLNMNGYWWVEVTTPKIMKGKYSLGGNIWTGGGLSDYVVYVDGVQTATIKASVSGTKVALGEFNWTKTEEHKVKLVAISWGMLFWDTLVFTPIK